MIMKKLISALVIEIMASLILLIIMQVQQIIQSAMVASPTEYSQVANENTKSSFNFLENDVDLVLNKEDFSFQNEINRNVFNDLKLSGKNNKVKRCNSLQLDGNIEIQPSISTIQVVYSQPKILIL